MMVIACIKFTVTIHVMVAMCFCILVKPYKVWQLE